VDVESNELLWAYVTVHAGENHYDALIDPNVATVGVGLGLAGFKPGLADQTLLEHAAKQSDLETSEAELIKAALKQSLEDAWGDLKRSKRQVPTFV